MRTPSRALSLAFAAVLLASCGGGGNSGNSGTAPTTSIQVAEVNTNPPATTVVATTTTNAPVTTSTTLPPLPTPIKAPAQGVVEPKTKLGTIEIPKIGVSRTLYEGITLETLNAGPGHWPGTAMPGQFGNAVIGGHRTSHGKPFRNIDQLVPGDEVILTTADGRFVYHVTSTEIVTPDAVRIVDQTPGYTATLFACHPPGSTSHRIVVHLELAG